MFKNDKVKNIIYAICVLSGTIIGVAMFSLPYLTTQVGWMIMLLYFLILGGLMILLHVFFGELVVATPDGKRFPGIAEYHWGKKGKYISLFSHTGALIGAILAYILVGGGFLYQLLLVNGIDVSMFGAILIFWAAGAFIMFKGSSALNVLQVVGIISFFFILGALIWIGRGEASLINIFARSSTSISWFAPYGALVFSLWGASLIPQIEDTLVNYKKYLSKVIAISIILSIFVYLAFIAIVLSISGSDIGPLSLIGLSDKLGPSAYSLILVFGIITTFTSYAAIGFTMTQVFQFDLKVGRIKSWLITIFVPITFYVIGIKDFLEVVVFVGAVLLAIDGVNMLLMHRKQFSESKQWKHLVSLILILILILGIGYEVASLFGVITY